MRSLLLALVAGFTGWVFLCGVPALAGMAAPEYEERTFSKEGMEDFQNDPDYKYATPKTDPLKEELLARIANWIGKLFSYVPGGIWGFLPYVLVAIAIGLTVFYIRKITFTGAVGAQSNAVSRGELFEENIHTIDFNKAIADAVAAGELRLATRLYFLMTLKLLHDKELIQHSRDKTNRDYLRELKTASVKDDFKWLITSFEFVWYGNTQPGPALFQSVQQRYTDFFKQVEQKGTR